MKTKTTAIRSERRVNAESAQAAWIALTPEKQLAALDSRLGKNKGAKKQRRRLTKAILAS